MTYLFCLVLGFLMGYLFCRTQYKAEPIKRTPQLKQHPVSTFQHKLQMKAYQSDSDRIRELNLLGTNHSVFLRQLKQNFKDSEIAIKNHRFIILDRDHMPKAIFEYRDGTEPMKMVDQEDDLPLFLYKGLISSELIKQDYLSINSKKNS